VDFSDPKLPKMTMTTFDGKPYIEQYTLSKLEILPDFGSEKKAAPTPVRAPFSARRFFWKASLRRSALHHSCWPQQQQNLTRVVGAPSFLEGLQAFKRGFWYAAIK
jgi:hypothetical protein